MRVAKIDLPTPASAWTMTGVFPALTIALMRLLSCSRGTASRNCSMRQGADRAGLQSSLAPKHVHAPDGRIACSIRQRLERYEFLELRRRVEVCVRQIAADFLKQDISLIPQSVMLSLELQQFAEVRELAPLQAGVLLELPRSALLTGRPPAAVSIARVKAALIGRLETNKNSSLGRFRFWTSARRRPYRCFAKPAMVFSSPLGGHGLFDASVECLS